MQTINFPLELTCQDVPNKQISIDCRGLKWYKKGMNSSKDRIFLTCALPGCYGRAYNITDSDVLVITQTHIIPIHEVYNDKKMKRKAKKLQIKQ
mmetsp:Transcript_25274/g.22396  ORF Transcript_25274/g.22396 Transcript_25274/m.22396 type:complete len:94 (+) Transcript_25274:156-437(+)